MERQGYYFGAGPAALPEDVLHQAQSALLNWNNSGLSILEVGHRSALFMTLLQQTEEQLRALLRIPQDYHVFFLGGAARAQFSMMPMNFLSEQQPQAAYMISGVWSSLAYEEAKRLGGAYAIKPGEACKPGTAYAYYTPNETVDGVRFAEIPDTGSVPLVADMTSCLLSEVVDVSRFGLIFAGAQKNIGPAGLTLVIVRKSMLNILPKHTVPTMLDYRVHAKHHSLYATPPVFQCYMAAKMFQWVKDQGGVRALEAINQAKAAKLYAYIDASADYQCMVNDVASRSLMNVCFLLTQKKHEAEFLKQAEACGLRGLKGHRVKGGIRASLYNAMPMEGVDALIAFMDDFSKGIKLMQASTLVSSPVAALHGEVVVPGDKSISHRALILGAIAEGVTYIAHMLEGEDCLATLHILRALGVRIERLSDGRMVVYGVGLHGLTKPDKILDCGNSGTSMRLLAGLLVGQKFDSVLTGDASLLTRPMARICVPLTQMGADICSASDNGRAPLFIRGGQALQAIDYAMPVASAQVKSSVLLAGLYAEGETRVQEPQITRDHTERMLRVFLNKSRSSDVALNIPGDVSSAAFFMVAASLIPGAEIVLRGVGVNPTRTGVIQILRAMGADITLENKRMCGEEPVADILVRYAALKGIDIAESMVSLSIDEFPVLFIAAAMASGTTRVLGIEELRYKESDRISVMAEGLKVLGIKLRETKDSIVIHGGKLQGGVVDSHADHRVAMAFLVAGAVANAEITVLNSEAILTSFPAFVELFNAVGGHVAPA